MSQRLGRNDSCWCGSGKKYKKCHLEADEQAARDPDSAPMRTPPYDPKGLINRVSDDHFADALRMLGKKATNLKIQQCFGDRKDLEDDEMERFVNWAVLDSEFSGTGRTVLEEYLRRNQDRIPAEELEVLEGWTATSVGVYEVLAIRRGSGVDLKDLLNGSFVAVSEIRLSQSCSVGEWIVTRVAPFQDKHILFGNGTKVPPAVRDRFLDWLEEERDRPDQPWLEVLRKLGPKIEQKIWDMADEWRENVQISNSAGDPLVFSTARFVVMDHDSLVAALDQCRYLDRQPARKDDLGRIHYVLLDESLDVRESGSTVLGTKSVSPGARWL